jgi:hypothetical protein
MMNNKNWKTRLPVDMADSATGLTELLDLRGLVDRVGEHLLFLLLSVLSQRHCTQPAVKRHWGRVEHVALGHFGVVGEQQQSC